LEFCSFLTMSKSGMTACRIVHIICGLDAWVLHEVCGSRKERHRTISRKRITVDNKSGQRAVMAPNMRRPYIDHLCVLVRGVLLPVLALQDRSATRSNRQPKPLHRKSESISYRSLSSFRVVITTLLGWIPTGALAPLVLSRCTRSTWITHFLR
jgi:hypothetical protein